MPIFPQRRFKARIVGRFRLPISVATAVLGVVGLGSSVGASPSPSPGTGIGTLLPPGWELCVLQGVGASGTQDNVTNLDEWQVAEGGSTANNAAYNPFNTRNVTDSNGTPVPALVSSDGFPAFTTWAAGCAATVATLLQPNMAPIVAALKTGNISPPGLFLSEVDRSPWCAPSADGVPCYASQILAGQLIKALIGGSSRQLKDALTSFSNTGSDLRSYEQDAYVAAADQTLLAAKDEQLAVTAQEVAVAQGTLSRATRALRQLALDDYTSASGVRTDAHLQLFGPSNDQAAVAQYLGNIVASVLTVRYDQAKAVVRTSIAKEQEATASVAQATTVLDSAAAAESKALSGLEADVKGIETGLSCTAPSLIDVAAPPLDNQSSAAQLWTTLQNCLAPTPQVGTPATRSAPR